MLLDTGWYPAYFADIGISCKLSSFFAHNINYKVKRKKKFNECSHQVDVGYGDLIVASDQPLAVKTLRKIEKYGLMSCI
jgi:hypothetical protein